MKIVAYKTTKKHLLFKAFITLNSQNASSTELLSYLEPASVGPDIPVGKHVHELDKAWHHGVQAISCKTGPSVFTGKNLGILISLFTMRQRLLTSITYEEEPTVHPRYTLLHTLDQSSNS